MSPDQENPKGTGSSKYKFEPIKNSCNARSASLSMSIARKLLDTALTLYKRTYM